MATVINRSTKRLIYSVNTPDYSEVDWIINPDLSELTDVPQKYWKIVGDTVVEMTPEEKSEVDIALAAIQRTATTFICGFGYNGKVVVGRWLESLTCTEVIIAGSKTCTALSFGCKNSATVTATIYKNGYILDTIDIVADTKNTKFNLFNSFLDKDIISAQITSGSCENPVLVLW